MSDAPWQRNLRPQLAELVAYDVAPAQAFARMHANELPEPWPAHVMDALAEVVRTVELGRYPDTSGRSLRAVLGRRHGCDPARIVLGNGSDEIISLVLTALGGAPTPTLVIPSPTFVMYRLSARVLGYEVREVPLDDAMELDRQAMHRALVGATVCFLARPNNPTGTLWSAATVRELVAAHPEVVFVLDEAYIAYAPGASLWQPDGPDNLVHMATLSKVGLAALRVGYAIATPVLAGALDKIRHPYNVSQTSLALAEAVLTRFGAEQQAMIATAIEQRVRLSAALARIPGARVYPSAANLVLARVGSAEQAAALCARLAEHGVLIKDMGAHPLLRGCVRASVGTAAELDRLESLLA